MYTDPQVVTVSTVAKSLPRVGTSLNASKYQTADRSRALSVTHTSGRRNQDRARLDYSKIVTDPLASDRNLPVGLSVYLVVDTPPTGFSNAEIAAEIIALADWLKTSTNTDKLVGGEI
jgi:hypothetical protein